MTIEHLFRLYCRVAIVAFPLIAASHLVRHRPLGHALTEAAQWSAISALVFVVFQYRQARRGKVCAMCEPPR
ncbi:hypothetical protein LK996_11965 [Lysobacter sp. A6]|uniref:Uncharacterized protein n=1 Tax=Noviluteimonas lactosilytica TaxID=2888523 RepID=A0ABS8JJJ8_9GAMM|nr:hypothetical protein [Lysobacter lactosilyticus]MCC8363788.1 hypothetical protein [Lysobacter lactosilyticus]